MKAKLADGSRPAEGDLCSKLHRWHLEVMSEIPLVDLRKRRHRMSAPPGTCGLGATKSGSPREVDTNRQFQPRLHNSAMEKFPARPDHARSSDTRQRIA